MPSWIEAWIGSGEEDENVKSLQTDRRADDRQLEKLESSGELKKNLLVLRKEYGPTQGTYQPF